MSLVTNCHTAWIRGEDARCDIRDRWRGRLLLSTTGPNWRRSNVHRARSALKGNSISQFMRRNARWGNRHPACQGHRRSKAGCSGRCHFSRETRGFPFPSTVAVAASRRFGTFFLTCQTPCSFLISPIPTRINLIPPLDTSAAGTSDRGAYSFRLF
jgi:hypothetical protein